MNNEKQIVNGITYNWIGESEYGNVSCFPASEYFDCEDMWLEEGKEAPVKVVEPAHVMTEEEYTKHILFQDNRMIQQANSFSGRNRKFYTN